MMQRAWGIARSLAMYRAIPGRKARMARLYGEFLSPHDLAFDIGAHVGSRVRVWRSLGAHVIAVEPQPDCLRVLRQLHGRDSGVTIVAKAVGAQPGLATLHISSATPTVSSLSPGWITDVTRDARFARVKWDQSVDVEVTTLDVLMATFGEPDFCKIDVEGFEVDVLSGLSTPLKALSFEYLPAAHDQAIEALGRVCFLGDYNFNYSPIETMKWASPRWLEASELISLLDRLRPLGRSGDVYARGR
jgi:FkbM family methyltransferase